MRIIYYSAASEPTGEKLQRVIEMNFSKDQIDNCRTVKALSERLEQPSAEQLIVVILVTDHKDLDNIIRLQELLLGRRIILVLPDGKEETTSRGHRLRPRFITYRNNDYVDVSVVLGRMIRSYNSGFQGNACI